MRDKCAAGRLEIHQHSKALPLLRLQRLQIHDLSGNGLIKAAGVAEQAVQHL